MSKSIIQQLQNGITLEELLNIIDTIPIQSLEEFIKSTDLNLQEILSDHSQLLHANMQSYHNMGSIKTIKNAFNDIEKYLKYIVRNDLSLYHRCVIAITEFFGEYISEEQLEESLGNVHRARNEILAYNTVLIHNNATFIKHLNVYNLWVKALSDYMPIIKHKYSKEHAAMVFMLSNIMMQSLDLLATYQQLKVAVELQIQNNKLITQDILHVSTVSLNLTKNIISARQFFEQEYVGSIKIISKYK